MTRTTSLSDNSRPVRRVYRFEYALAFALLLTLALPLPLMLLRGLTRHPILEWRQGVPAGENPAPIEGADLYHRWERKAKAISGKAMAFQEAFARSFGGRTTLRQWHGDLLARVFGISPAPEVIVGKSGWLFYTGEDSMDGFRGVNPFTPEELERLRGALSNRRAELEKQGIVYLAVLPPDKQTFYPEFMPERYARIGPSRLEQTAAYLREHPGAMFVDLRPVLQKARAANPARLLYYKRDTHWNLVGAYIGYHAVAERLREKFSAVRPLELSDLERRDGLKAGGDLARMIQRDGDAEPEETLTPRSPPPKSPESAAWGYVAGHTTDGATVTTEYPTGEINRAIIFHDSFMQAQSLYLTRHFRHAVWRWGKYDPALVAQEKPDLVIEERIERRLYGWAGR